MLFTVQMEDGSTELVANANWDGETFNLHYWGNVRLVATINDDVEIVGDDSIVLPMSALRELDAGTTSCLKTGGELRRARTYNNRKGINKEARPFNKE